MSPVTFPPRAEPVPCPICGELAYGTESRSGMKAYVPGEGTWVGSDIEFAPRGARIEPEPRLDEHRALPCGDLLTRKQAEQLQQAIEATRPRVTPVSNFRIPLDIKAAAQAKAESRGETLTDVVVRALDRYAKRR